MFPQQLKEQVKIIIGFSWAEREELSESKTLEDMKINDELKCVTMVVYEVECGC